MKLAVASDIHLEFGPVELENTENADILILAGDTLVVEHFNHKDLADYYYDFLDNISTEFYDIIYILGNHEHYHYNFDNTFNDLKSKLIQYPNIHLLEKESIIFNNTRFICGTMWTDFNRIDPLTMFQIKKLMSDFVLIDKGEELFTPKDALEDYLKFLEYAIDELRSSVGETIVMVTHHSPSFSTVNDKYSYNSVLIGGYCSNLDNLILDNPKIKLWISGHQHDRHDFMIGPTRLVNNARGYFDREPQATNYSLKYIDI